MERREFLQGALGILVASALPFVAAAAPESALEPLPDLEERMRRLRLALADPEQVQLVLLERGPAGQLRALRGSPLLSFRERELDGHPKYTWYFDRVRWERELQLEGARLLLPDGRCFAERRDPESFGTTRIGSSWSFSYCITLE